MICLEDPRMIVQGPEGQMGFAQGVAVTGEKNPTAMQIQSYVFTTKTNDQVAEAYRTHISGIEIVPNNLIVDK